MSMMTSCGLGVRGRVSAAMTVMAALVALAAVISGCGKKPSETKSQPAPEITGLATVPATAEVVLGADIAKLADAPVIERAVEQLLLRDEPLARRWGRLQEDCKIDLVKQVKRVMLAVGPSGGKPGTGPVLLVVIGSIPEADLRDCVSKLVGGGNGAITGKVVFGRTLYIVRDSGRTLHFGYGRPDTIVLGADEAFVTEALSTGKKASDNPELGRWLALADQRASLWAAGRIDARIRDGLLQMAGGRVRGGPLAMAATAELTDGASLKMSVVMPSDADAASLASYAKAELALLTAAAQVKSLGPVVGKVTVAADKEIVHLRAPLTTVDLNLLLSTLDGGSVPAQDSAPPLAGSGTGPK
jgi:hypothetical protein